MQSPGICRLAAILVLLVLIGCALWMNSGYSRISDRSYDYALALVSACGRHDEARVQRIAKEVGEQGLPAYDRRVILSITKRALKGNWEAASHEARELLKAQSQTAK